MSMITIRSPDGAEQHAVDELDWAEGLGEDNPYAGWTKVADTEPQDHDAVIVDGQWVVPLDVLKSRKLETVKDEQGARFAMGWAHTFSVGDHVLDMRDADDKANWTLLLIKTNAMMASGAGDVPVKLKTAFNDEILIPASEANAAMQTFLAWGEAMLKKKWDLDKAINDAADDIELAAIDITAAWPA